MRRYVEGLSMVCDHGHALAGFRVHDQADATNEDAFEDGLRKIEFFCCKVPNAW